MGAKLVAYECVPLGFEVVIDHEDVEMGKIWNLWHNIKLSDDPESWDSEIHLVNKMQGRLGQLTADQRLIRAQMAEFCRVHPLFPQSVEILCNEIGGGRFSKPAKIGCEGRGLLDSLGYHDEAILKEQGKGIISDYIRALEKWLRRGRPETSIESKVFGFLSHPTESKVRFVEKLIHMADSDEPSLSSLMDLTGDACEGACKGFQMQAHESHLGRPFNCFKCLSDAGGITKCQCCYSMLLDSGLLCVGKAGEVKLMIGEFRRFVEENILSYSNAINSWLNEEPPKEAWLKDARYVSENGSFEMVEDIRSSLGKRNEVKEWLAACLLKTVKDNQRWHKRAELIDDFPGATSWFRESLR